MCYSGVPQSTATIEHNLRLALGAQLDVELGGFSSGLYQTLETITEGREAQQKGRLLRRYLEFPLWDVIVFPVRALARLGETHRIGVVRMSPEEAAIPGSMSAKEKLAGTKAFHFAAFLRRRWRERDYVWGRIDGAQHLIKMLVDDTEKPFDDSGVENEAAWKACETILTEERDLRGTRQVKRSIDEARAEISSL